MSGMGIMFRHGGEEMEEGPWNEWAEALYTKTAEWLKQETREENEAYLCNRCGTGLMTRVAHCSIHNGYKMFKDSHSGGGSVQRVEIPECPNESCPNHRPSFWDGQLSLNEASDTLYGPCIDS